MPRIAGVNIPKEKQIKIALTYIFGIGKILSEKILKEAEIDLEKRASDLTTQEIDRLKQIIEKNYKIEGGLRRERMRAVKRLKDIKCWRGVRHIKGLPVRGQTTRTNSRTIRGNVRTTVGSGRRKAPAPK